MPLGRVRLLRLMATHPTSTDSRDAIAASGLWSRHGEAPRHPDVQDCSEPSGPARHGEADLQVVSLRRPTGETMTKVERWERNVEIPLLLLALAFLAAYALLVVDQGLEPSVRGMLVTVSWTVWVAFGVDFAVRLYLAEQRLSYARRHWYDVALVALPVLRPLRLLRVFALARILNRSAAGSLLGQVTAYAAGVAVMSVGLGSLAVLDAEQDAQGANITAFGDALWWSATTVTTVGYGDRYPVTTEGRLIAVALMIVGIGLVGAVTASVAAWMVRQVQLDQDDPE